MHKKQTIQWLLLLVIVLGALLFSAAAVMAAEETPAPAGAEGETTAAASTSPLTPLGINSGFLIAQIINFLIIFLALTFGLWRPMRNMLDARAAKIQKGLEDAAVAANARKNAEAEAETIRTSARAEVGKAIEEGRVRGEEVRKQVIAEANAEAEKIRADARAAAASERDAELAGLRGQVAAIAIAAANKLIGEAMDEKRQKALIDDFFAKVPDHAKKLGGKVEVISAMPLSEAEQKKVRGEVGSDDVSFVVDPSILGGLIVRSGERVVDGSVRSGLNELASRLN